MSFNDFLTEFEKLDICLLPDERFLTSDNTEALFWPYFSKTNCHHVIGNFAGGVNSPKNVDELVSNYLNPAMTHQVDIIVKEKAQDVFIQLLLDCTGKIRASTVCLLHRQSYHTSDFTTPLKSWRLQKYIKYANLTLFQSICSLDYLKKNLNIPKTNCWERDNGLLPFYQCKLAIHWGHTNIMGKKTNAFLF